MAIIKPSCYWMIGISGSGKTEVAKQISKEKNAVLLSSDAIREELYGDSRIQGNPKQVFDTLHNRAIESLKMGISIIYDATNLSLKNRIQFFNLVKNKNLEVNHHAIVMSKSLNMCIEDNNKRDRVVPEQIIRTQVKKFNMPFFEEGFNTITITGWKNFDKVTQDDYRYAEVNIKGCAHIINSMDEFHQDNPHHELTLGYHCDKVQTIVRNFSDDKALITASLFHDIGKMYTKSIDDNGISHYYGHAEVGTYYLLQNLDALNGLGMRSVDVIKSLFYCNYHMRPFDWKNEEIKEKYKKLFGAEKYNNLWLLHNADIRGCKKDDKIIFET
jgi:predicted kinase